MTAVLVSRGNHLKQVWSEDYCQTAHVHLVGGRMLRHLMEELHEHLQALDVREREKEAGSESEFSRPLLLVMTISKHLQTAKCTRHNNIILVPIAMVQ